MIKKPLISRWIFPSLWRYSTAWSKSRKMQAIDISSKGWFGWICRKNIQEPSIQHRINTFTDFFHKFINTIVPSKVNALKKTKHICSFLKKAKELGLTGSDSRCSRQRGNFKSLKWELQIFNNYDICRQHTYHILVLVYFPFRR